MHTRFFTFEITDTTPRRARAALLHASQLGSASGRRARRVGSSVSAACYGSCHAPYPHRSRTASRGGARSGPSRCAISMKRYSTDNRRKSVRAPVSSASHSKPSRSTLTTIGRGVALARWRGLCRAARLAPPGTWRARRYSLRLERHAGDGSRGLQISRALPRFLSGATVTHEPLNLPTAVGTTVMRGASCGLARGCRNGRAIVAHRLDAVDRKARGGKHK